MIDKLLQMLKALIKVFSFGIPPDMFIIYCKKASVNKIKFSFPCRRGYNRGTSGRFLVTACFDALCGSFYMRKTRGAKSALRVFGFIFAF